VSGQWLVRVACLLGLVDSVGRYMVAAEVGAGVWCRNESGWRRATGFFKWAGYIMSSSNKLIDGRRFYSCPDSAISEGSMRSGQFGTRRASR
jgi:hypothetical protein